MANVSNETTPMDTGPVIVTSPQVAAPEPPPIVTNAQVTTTQLPQTNAQVTTTQLPQTNAQATTTEPPSTEPAATSNNVSDRDCAVCLETMVQPTELPCKHVFCFLCVKGIAQKTRCCALCRREIPLNYFDSPHLLNDPVSEKLKEKTCSDDEDRPLWYYKGRSGWWQYDDRTREEIENAYSKKEQTCEVLIAGYLYVIDFTVMTQFRKDDPVRRRSVKRETHPIKVKGVAGVPLPNQNDSTPNSSGCPRPDTSSNHPGHSIHHFDANDPGPSCSIVLLNFGPSHVGPSTSYRPQSNKKDSQGGCAAPRSTNIEEIIIIPSDSDDDLESSDDDLSDLDDDDDDDDSMEEEEDSDDDMGYYHDTSSDEDPDVVWNQDFYGGSHGVGKQKASNTSASVSSKKHPSSLDYKTALRLMKAEHAHRMESVKLKHTRALMQKKNPQELQSLKKQNRLTLEKLKRKHLNELKKLKTQYNMRK